MWPNIDISHRFNRIIIIINFLLYYCKNPLVLLINFYNNNDDIILINIYAKNNYSHIVASIFIDNESKYTKIIMKNI
jgi:hypothetical protein